MVLKKEKENFIFAVFLTVLLGIYIYIYSLIPKEERSIEIKIIEYATSNTIQIIKNSLNFTLEKEEATVKRLFEDKKLRNKIREFLRSIKTDKIKYIFIIYKDEGNKYRYLIDPEFPRDSFGALFIPFDEEVKILESVLKEKQGKFIINSKLKTIGVTHYIPLKDNNEVRAVLVVDFAFDVLKEVEALVDYIKFTVLTLITVTLILIVASAFTLLRMLLLRKKSFEDALTKVYNRKFLSHIENTIDLNDYVVVLTDIDFFKQINDTYGHKVGDEVLQEFASLLKSSLRKDDIIIRYGGEEFLILLKKDRNVSHSEIIRVIERLLDNIRKHRFGELKITASFGINLDTDKARSLSDAIKKADLALYKAKREGRDRIEIYTEKDDDISLSDIKEMIEKDQLTFFYQPVINMETGNVVYFESLLRFLHKGKPVPPFRYLEMIKGTFLYSKLSKKVIEFNAKTLVYYKDLKISINLSPADITNEAIVNQLLSYPRNIATRLKIEIIETEEIKDYEKLKTSTQLLRERGYEIALDDFGKGYINFFYITEIPANYIKIDGSIIRKLLNDEKYLKLTKNIANFAEETNMRIIAEFVESEDTVNKLLEINVKFGQGYYFGKPKPLKEFLKEEGKDENIN